MVSCRAAGGQTRVKTHVQDLNASADLSNEGKVSDERRERTPRPTTHVGDVQKRDLALDSDGSIARALVRTCEGPSGSAEATTKKTSSSLRMSAITSRLMSLLPGVRMLGDKLTRPRISRAAAEEVKAATTARVVREKRIMLSECAKRVWVW